MAVEAVASYRQSMAERAETGVLEGWYSGITLADAARVAGGDKEARRRAAKRVAEAHRQTHEHVAAKLLTATRGRTRIVDQPPLLYHTREVTDGIIAAFFKRYRATLGEDRRRLFDRFQLVDVALKVVGVGSVGTRCYVALFLAAPDDPLFLQVKEARRSVLEPYARPEPVAHKVSASSAGSASIANSWVPTGVSTLPWVSASQP